MGKEEAHIVDLRLLECWMAMEEADLRTDILQTETDSHVITQPRGLTLTKPGSTSSPLFGIESAIIDSFSGE